MTWQHDLDRRLAADALRHVAQRKVIGRIPDVLMLLEGAGWLAIVYPPGATPWDAELYPDADAIVLPLLDSPEAADDAASAIGERFTGPLVTKSIDGGIPAAFACTHTVEHIRTFESFTLPAGSSRLSWAQRVIVAPASASCLAAPIHAVDGFHAAELDRLGAQGWLSCWVPGSACLVFPVSGDVWEIGSLRTVGEGGRGAATAVVRAAVAELTDLGRRIRYHVESTNEASKQVARNAGLEPYQVLAHHVVTPLR